MNCRPGCAACCVAPSITSGIPGMPGGKPAGTSCVNLTLDGLCRLFGDPARPGFCSSLRPAPEMCGTSRDEAFAILAELERMTRPEPGTT